LNTDIQPITAFRANTAALIARVRETKRPVVLTQHGRGAAVLLDVDAYQEMLDRQETGGGAVRPPEVAADPAVDAYKEGIDRSLIRENLTRSVGERLRRLDELAVFSEQLRTASRRERDGAAGENADT
jgi:prevent-host-death family protein